MLLKIRATPKHRPDARRGRIERSGRWMLLVVSLLFALVAAWIIMPNPGADQPDRFASDVNPGSESAGFRTTALPRPSSESRTAKSPTNRAPVDHAKHGPAEADGADPAARTSPDRASGQPNSGNSLRPPLLTITGTVLDETGIPLAGVEVGAEPAPSARTLPVPVLRTITDNAGMFRFQPDEGGEYRLHVAESPDFHEAYQTVRTGIGIVDIVVQRKGSVRVVGIVHDANGQPLADTRIRTVGGHGTASSNQMGEYAVDIESIGPGRHAVVRFSRRGFRTAEHRIDLRTDDSPVELDVDLQPIGPSTELFGIVAGQRGEAVTGAEIRIRSAATGLSRRQTTGPDGEYRFEALEQESDYRIDVRTADGSYRPYSSEAIALQRAQVAFDITLQDGGQASLAGWIVDPGGKPLRDFDLWLRSLDASRSAPLLVRSNDRGRFDPVSLPAGRLRMQSRSQPRIELSGLELDPGEFLEVQLPVDWGDHWLFGRVTDPAERAIRGARVTLQWTHRQGELHSLSQRTTRTDFDGYFSFGNLAGDVYRLIGTAPGYGTRRIDVRPTAEEDVAVVLSPQH
ncbi:MAG: carboxypeptidase regulatory-like domain-containing protein [Candidatus Wenzhouxiangella sp. M2_3B_020]